MDRLLGIKKDEMTNCYMKNGIYPLLSMLAEEYPSTKKPFTVLMTDLDHFKSYNDNYGHLLGDEIIKYFSSSIRLDLYGLENFPFRFGGDEFVIVFPGRTEEVVPLVNRMRENMKTRKCLIKGTQVNLTFSGGVASFPIDGDTIEAVLDCADKALYEAKRLGRNRITVFSRMWSETKQKNMQIAAAVGAVLAVMGLAFFYQDILNGVTGIVRSDRTTSTVRHIKGTLGEMLRSATEAADTMKAPAVRVNVLTSDPIQQMQGDPETTATPEANIVKEPLPAQAIQTVSTVHLKSGGKLKGTIMTESETDIKIKLAVSGEAVMTIQKTSIEKIDHGGI
ncbi:MAG: GGDEF domain-containing protein [Micavibrio sp.]|nr:GGDEF domain-containing protein [Micavibrio sp.]